MCNTQHMAWDLLFPIVNGSLTDTEGPRRGPSGRGKKSHGPKVGWQDPCQAVKKGRIHLSLTLNYAVRSGTGNQNGPKMIVLQGGPTVYVLKIQYGVHIL